jgi:probable HAF family extracellular repeat protein
MAIALFYHERINNVRRKGLAMKNWKGDCKMKTTKKFKIHRILKAIVVILMLPIVSKAEIRYNVITLEKLTPDATFYAYSINNDGAVVGYALSSRGASEAILFDPTGHQRGIALGALPDFSYSRAYAVNHYGQVVGSSFNGSRQSIATLFDITGSGNNIALGTLGGAIGTAYSVNDSGQIVGYAADSSGAEHATLFDLTGRGYNIDLGTLRGCTNSYATSINNNGQIIGYCVDDAGQFYAAMFDLSGSGRNVNLGTLGGLLSVPNKINNYGQIAGVSGVAPSTQHATLFKLPGGAEHNFDLGALPSKYGDSEALSINNNGQIVGYCIIDASEARATLFDISGEGNNIDLNTLIDPASGWILNYAYSINDNGMIVGNGSRGAFLLEPISTFTDGSLPPDKY